MIRGRPYGLSSGRRSAVILLPIIKWPSPLFCPRTRVISPLLLSSPRLRQVCPARVGLYPGHSPVPPFGLVVPRRPAPSAECRRSGGTVLAPPFCLFSFCVLLYCLRNYYTCVCLVRLFASASGAAPSSSPLVSLFRAVRRHLAPLDLA